MAAPALLGLLLTEAAKDDGKKKGGHVSPLLDPHPMNPTMDYQQPSDQQPQSPWTEAAQQGPGAQQQMLPPWWYGNA